MNEDKMDKEIEESQRLRLLRPIGLINAIMKMDGVALGTKVSYIFDYLLSHEADPESPWNKNVWIKCSERMPEKDVRVLVWHKDHNFDHATIGTYDPKPLEHNSEYKNGSWLLEDDIMVKGHHMPKYITHWMELPEKPKENV